MLDEMIATTSLGMGSQLRREVFRETFRKTSAEAFLQLLDEMLLESFLSREGLLLE